MYCPKCAAQNADESRFCRACGANLSLITQAMEGRLPEAADSRFARALRKKREPSIERAVTSLFVGLGFLTVALGIGLTGEKGAFTMLIPAFYFLGRGVAQIISLQSAAKQAQPPLPSPMHPATTNELSPAQLPARSLPVSITEETTRALSPAIESVRDRK